MGIIGIVPIVIAILIFLFSISTADETQSILLGESIKIPLDDSINHLKIESPSGVKILKPKDNSFIFKPSEEGVYKITLTSEEETIVKNFLVSNIIQDSEIDYLQEIESISEAGSFVLESGNFSFDSISSISLTDSQSNNFNSREMVNISSVNDQILINLNERAFKPGIYYLNASLENGRVIEKEFAYGLITMNTKKSVHQSDEEVEFEIALLNSAGAGVCNAWIEVEVITPKNLTELFDSSHIVPSDECGLYQLIYKNSLQGEYDVKLRTKLDSRDISFKTSFLVDNNYPYNIIRLADTKIDPTQQDWFEVIINISSVKNTNELLIKEYVPSVFNITTNAEVSIENNAKVLTWNISSDNASVSYSYSVPDIWPYMYSLGKLTVNEEKEYRPWYIAVDPLISVTNVSSQDIALATLDNRTFAVAWIQPSPISLQFKIYDTNGTNKTSNVTVTTGLDADSRVSITAINSTSMIIAWDDGDVGSEDGNARGYTRIGTPWFNQFEFEAAVGTPAVDVDVIPMVDRYHICYIDDGESDADIKSYRYSAPATLVGTETNLDGAANPDLSLQNLFKCSAVNESRFVAFWFDDSGDTASYAILNETRGVITTQTNIDSIGTAGQVAVTSLNQNSFAMAYYDSVLQDIKISIRDLNNNAILGITTIDTASGATSQVAIATVKNRTENKDWFVVAWNDRDADAINASVFNSTGSMKYHYTLATDENTTNLLFDISGIDSLLNQGICDERYILAYTNDTGSVVTKTLNLDGSDWSGYCDFDSPLVNITFPLNTTYPLQSMNINVTLNELGSEVKYTLNDGVTNFSLSSLNYLDWNATNSSIADGSYTLKIFANNTNGLRNDTSQVTFSIDTKPPYISINSPPFNLTNYSTSSILFNLTVDEVANSCVYTLNNGVNNITLSTIDSINFNATNSSIADRLYNSIFYCNDTFNNIATNFTFFRIDTIPPLASISEPRNINYTTNSIEINISVSDSGTGVQNCYYTIDNGATNTTLSNCENSSFTSPEGWVNLTLYGEDFVGNLNSTSKSQFFVDSIKPLIGFVNPTPLNGSSREDTFLFINVSVTESNFANITYEIYNISSGSNHLVNRTTYDSLVTSINFTNLDNSFSNYTYQVSVSDILGNVNSTVMRTVTLTLGDISPPDIFFNTPSANNYFYNYSSVYFQVELSEEGDLVWYSINDSLTNYTMQTTNNITWNATNSSIADANYRITVYANDSAGNSGSRSRNFSVDTMRPLISYGEGTEQPFANVSLNWIFVNVSVIELNEELINFTLYDSGGLVASTYSTTGLRDVNWTSLQDKDYFYNVTIIDKAGNKNFTETRVIRIDTTTPLAILYSPQNNTYSNSRNQNLTVNATDNLGLANATLFVYNSSSSLVNQTFIFNYGTSSLFGVNITLPYDDSFTWFFKVHDSANNMNMTDNQTLLIDSTNPLISFSDGTESNNSVFERDWIFVNVSVTESNFANITYELYNNTAGMTLVNRTTYDSLVTSINFTGLNSENVTYYYNTSTNDLMNNFNLTETRTIKLADITPPTLSLIEPQNRTYFSNVSLLLNFTVSDVHLSNCWYNLNQESNITLSSCQGTEFNVSESNHILYLYANDSLGLTSLTNVTFSVNSSLLKLKKGILSYGEGTVQIPRYRVWNGTGFGSELNASTIGGTLEWIRSRSSPTRDENILVTADALDDINVQVNSSLNGVNCWHNGTACGSTWELTSTSTIINRLKVDVAYESKGTEALVVFSQGNSTPAYTIWNGTSFSNIQGIPQTLIGAGVVSYVKLQPHPFKEEIAMIMSNTSALNIIIWNGTEWGCQPSSLPSTLLTPEVYQHADLAYEQSSGALFVASSVNGITEIDYTTKEDGSCSYTTVRTTNLLEESEEIVINARPNSDHIILSMHDIGLEDMESIVWSGTQTLALSGNEIDIYPDVSPAQLLAPAWSGTSDYGLAIYSDNAVSLNMDYFRFNISTNAWEGGATGLDASGLTAFSDEEQNILSKSYLDQNKTLVIVRDDLDDLWAKTYDANTNAWIQPDGGTALETTISSAGFQSFDFNFNYDTNGPEIRLNSPARYHNSTSILFNITSLEDSTVCSYSLNSEDSIQLNSLSSRLFEHTNTSILDNQYNVSITCEDIWENSRTTLFTTTIDSTNPLISFSDGTESNNSVFERDWIFVNVSVTESNFANITYELYNNTAGMTLVNRTTYDSLITTINWTNLSAAIYYYNITINDLVSNLNKTETRTEELNRISPTVDFLYPSSYLNITNYQVSQFNFTVNDSSPLVNCSLYGNWSGLWVINQTILNPQKETQLNFSSITTQGDGFYSWNVYCYDYFGTLGFNSTNHSFSTFIYPESPIIYNVTQTSEDGRGNITLIWNSSNHSLSYKVYAGTNFTQLNLVTDNTSTNYTDSNFANNTRKFYLVTAVNPAGENASSQYFGAHVYTIRHTTNTKNLVAFPTNSSRIDTANNTLYNIPNITSVVLLNSTIQRKITCNKFSCPQFPECTETNCDFSISNGVAYSIFVNSSAPSAMNWSLVGIVRQPTNLTLIKNASSSGINWIALTANTSLRVASNLLINISGADAVSWWNSELQTSQGFIKNPLPIGPPYLGTNFTIHMERGYEVSVNRTVNWSQV